MLTFFRCVVGKAYAAQLSTITAEVRLLSSQISSVIDSQRHNSSTRQPSEAAASTGTIVQNEGIFSPEVLRKSLDEQFVKIAQRISELEKPSNSSALQSTNPLSIADSLLDCRLLTKSAVELTKDTADATAKALQEHQDAMGLKLQSVVDAVQRLGIDTPRFHAGMLDQLHSHGAQLQQIQKALAGTGPSGGGGAMGATTPTGFNSDQQTKLLGSFQDLSRAVLAKRDGEFRSFVEDLIAKEPQRRDRDQNLERVCRPRCRLVVMMRQLSELFVCCLFLHTVCPAACELDRIVARCAFQQET